MPESKHSAEWLRGRIAGIRHVADYMWESRWSWPAKFQGELDLMESMLAESLAARDARTPAQSLGRIKAEALREAIEEARNDEAAQESAATTRGALLCIADRLEKEAANDPR